MEVACGFLLLLTSKNLTEEEAMMTTFLSMDLRTSISGDVFCKLIGKDTVALTWLSFVYSNWIEHLTKNISKTAHDYTQTFKQYWFAAGIVSPQMLKTGMHAYFDY